MFPCSSGEILLAPSVKGDDPRECLCRFEQEAASHAPASC